MKRSKNLSFLLCLTLLAASLLTACGTARKEPVAAGDAAAETTETETGAPDAPAAESNETAASDETEAAAKTEAAQDTQNGSAEAETIRFIVDITDNLTETENLIIGNTANAEAYSGEIAIHLEASLLEKSNEIQVGNTYVFTVTPMMTMSIPPQVSAIDFAPASEADLETLENVRGEISNFKECMERYQSMSLEDIIADANLNYPIWTQDEIAEYNAFLIEKGYTEDGNLKSYVKPRSELNGSIFGGSYDN